MDATKATHTVEMPEGTRKIIGSMFALWKHANIVWSAMAWEALLSLKGTWNPTALNSPRANKQSLRAYLAN
jgi:hypothetical protein